MSAAWASSSSTVGGSVAMWRSLWRTTPACSEVWKEISSPVPTISSVEPPPMSTTRGGPVGWGSAGAPGCAGGPRGRGGDAARRRGEEGPAVLGVAHGAGRDRVDGLGSELFVKAHVAANRGARVLDRFGPAPAGEIDAAREPGHRAAPLARRHPVPGDVGDQQPRRAGGAGDHPPPAGP